MKLSGLEEQCNEKASTHRFKLTITVMSFSVFFNNSTAQALSPIWNRGYQTGYFDLQPANHQCYYWPGYPRSTRCYVIPDGINVNSVAGFMSVVTSNYYSGDYARQTGAAYIVHSMLGEPQGTATRNVTPAQFADLQARLNYVDSYGGIIWSYLWTTGEDGGTDDKIDVYISQNGQQDPAILFRDRAGNIIYALFRPCANPDGALTNGLPSVNFNLNPTVSVSPSGAAEAGTTVSVDASVNNTGASTSTDTQWKLTTFTVKAAPVALPPGGLDTVDPLVHYTKGTTLIGTPGQVTQGTRTFPRGVTSTAVLTQPLPDVPVGSRVCFALSVTPYTQSDSSWNNSAPGSTSCVVISKKPKVQVRSGDLEVGRGSATNPAATSNINTATTTKNGKTYGSWAEYGILPSGTVTGMASGAGYAGGAPTSTMCGLSLLTFTSGSTGGSCGTTIGKFVQATIAPNVSARFPINVPSDVATPSKPASPAALTKTSINIISDNLQGQYQAPAGATALTITGGKNIPPGRWVVINAPNATVTITDDITYTPATLHSFADIPQVVIIAKNILIADNVKQIDSWLVAVGSDVGGTPQGNLNTCATGAGITETSSLTYKDCATPLTINGPVITNHLIMRRTFGADAGADSGTPAETFNLRADAYIWATTYNLNSGRLSTVATKELPPRF